MKRLTLLGVTVLTVGLTTLAVAAAGQGSPVEGRRCGSMQRGHAEGYLRGDAVRPPPRRGGRAGAVRRPLDADLRWSGQFHTDGQHPWP